MLLAGCSRAATPGAVADSFSREVCDIVANPDVECSSFGWGTLPRARSGGGGGGVDLAAAAAFLHRVFASNAALPPLRACGRMSMESTPHGTREAGTTLRAGRRVELPISPAGYAAVPPASHELWRALAAGVDRAFSGSNGAGQVVVEAIRIAAVLSDDVLARHVVVDGGGRPIPR